MVKKQQNILDAQYSEEESYEIAKGLDTALWATETPIILDGSPFTFQDHEYQIEQYLDPERVEVKIKAAQIGGTVGCILKAIHRCKYIYPNGVLYLFPSKIDVTDFSQSKFAKIMEENAILRSWIRDTDRANLRSLGNGFFYFRGMKSRDALKTISVDLVVFDEYDEHLPSTTKEANEITTPEMALHRLSHSKYKNVMYLSTPTIPSFGIDAVFRHSDQKHWYIECKHCGNWTCLEREFIDADGDYPKILKVLPDGSVIKVCKYCEKEIFSRDGVWVAHREGRDLYSGTYISQLNSTYIDPKDILRDYEIHVLRVREPIHGIPNPQEFWNSMLGRAWVSADSRLTKEQIRSCCGMHGIANYDMGPCFMGIDQNKGIHVVIGTFRFGKPRVIHINIYDNFEELDGLMDAFNVRSCVIDANPERRKAFEFAKRHKGRIWCNDYTESKANSLLWDDEKLRVTDHRTMTLDESHVWIDKKMIVLPRAGEKITEDFISQCHNIAKRRIEDHQRNVKYKYFTLGEDHFRHAFNYMCLASLRVGGASMGDYEDVSEAITDTMVSCGKEWDE